MRDGMPGRVYLILPVGVSINTIHSAEDTVEAVSAEPAPPALTLMLATLLRYMATQLVQHLSAMEASGVLGSPRGGFDGAAIPDDLAQCVGVHASVLYMHDTGLWQRRRAR